MNYYKIVDRNDNFIGLANSYSMRYSLNGNIFSCFEDKAQYVSVNGQLYRIGWLHAEDEKMKGKFPVVRALIISKEEYDNYKEQQK